MAASRHCPEGAQVYEWGARSRIGPISCGWVGPSGCESTRRSRVSWSGNEGRHWRSRERLASRKQPLLAGHVTRGSIRFLPRLVMEVRAADHRARFLADSEPRLRFGTPAEIVRRA